MEYTHPKKSGHRYKSRIVNSENMSRKQPHGCKHSRYIWNAARGDWKTNPMELDVALPN